MSKGSEGMQGTARRSALLRVAGSGFNAFLDANRNACEAVAGFLPHTRVDVFERYSETVARKIAEHQGQLVVDVGAGHVCPYADRLPAHNLSRIVGVDLSLEKMEGNDVLEEKRVADVVADGLPFADGEVDIVTSRSVLEHLSNVDRFVDESSRVLRRGGYSIHLLSGGRAHVALINRVVPEKLSRVALYTLHPTSRRAGGQPTVYDRCHYRALKDMFDRNCHDEIDIYSSFGSDYLYFFFPFFLLESVYLITLRTLRLRDLAVSYLVVARRT
jgi:ubiquinone/menaquinone biosynthesis C-methylase UbiE